MQSYVTDSSKEKMKKAIWYSVYLTTYMLLGCQLGVMPIGEMLTNGLMYSFIGLSNVTKLDSIFQLCDVSLWMPYGNRLTEGFGEAFLQRFITILGFNGMQSMQIAVFIIYTMGYISMLTSMNKISKSKVFGLILTLVYFWNPVLVAQQGVPSIYFGILFMPVVVLVMMCFHQYIENCLVDGMHDEKLKKRGGRYVIGNFLCFLVLASTSWYLAVIVACATCLCYLLFLCLWVKQVELNRIVTYYLKYMLIPWVGALGINLLMTPRSVASQTTAMDFINGSSIDVITMLLPSSLQLISKIYGINDYISGDEYIPGNGVRFYLGYSIILLLVISVMWKKERNKINISILFAGVVLFVISLGPGLRLGATLGKEMINELGQYRLPIENNFLQFPWKKLFEMFPLNIMRAVCRWYIGVVVLFIVLAARVLADLIKENKKTKVLAYIICIVMVFEFVHVPGKMINEKTQHYITYQNAYAECVTELEEVFKGEANRLAFCSYDYNDNTYMVPLIMLGLENCTTYSGSGDKARGMARPYTPQCVYDYMHGVNPEDLAINITKMDAYDLADYAILPYYDLSNAVYAWPMSEEIVNRTKDIAEQVARRLEDRYSIIRLEHYMIFELNNVSESIQILAQEGNDNAKYFMTDAGFGTKYAIELEGVTFEKQKITQDNLLYIYSVMKAEHAGTAKMYVECKDSSEEIIDIYEYYITLQDEYAKMEFEILLPEGTSTVQCHFEGEEVGKKYLKMMQMSTCEKSSIKKSETVLKIEELLKGNLISAENVIVDENIIRFQEGTNIAMPTDYKSQYSYMKLKMDIMFNSNNDVEIMNKWQGWQNEMSYALAWHENEQKYYLNISGDGVTTECIMWDLQDMPKNQWNTMEIVFDSGELKLYINEQCILERQCTFSSVYSSHNPIRIGGGLVGGIRNFEYEVH